MFQQALAPAEADAEVDRWAIPCREGRPAAEQTLKLALWGLRMGSSRDVFSRRCLNRRCLTERRYFFANILFVRLHRLDFSGHLLLLAR